MFFLRAVSCDRRQGKGQLRDANVHPPGQMALKAAY
jgi:hypothetical protein